MGESEEFSSLLKSRLLQGNRIRVYHVSTRPKACPPLFAPALRRSEEATTLESHFLAISQTQHPKQASPGRNEVDVLILAIEVLIFVTSNLTTVFVSKADSTGLLTRPSTATTTSHRMSLAQTVITAFLDYLLTPRLNRRRLLLSLFARSQNQYLFPGSIQNVTKHVLDDRQLIKWWCKVLNPVARQARSCGLQDVTAHLVVPGCDGSETKAFFPPSNLADSTSNVTWSNTYPVDLLVPNTSLPPRCLVPRLPDDPKSRFLDDLDEHADDNGIWRGISTLDQFWEMMSYRQECSAGRLVGFVWLVFTPLIPSSESDNTSLDRPAAQYSSHVEQNGNPLSIRLPHSAPHPIAEPGLTEEFHHTACMTKPSASSLGAAHSTDAPVMVLETPSKAKIQPSIGELHGVTATTNSHCVSNADGVSNVSERTGEVLATVQKAEKLHETILTAEHYQDLMDELLRLDFEGTETAIESTQKWRKKVMELAEVTDCGFDVEGTAVVHDTTVLAAPKATPNINVLTGIRKKRKMEAVDLLVDMKVDKAPTINMLTSNLVRKKSKAL